MAPLGLRVPWPQSAGRVQWLAPSGGYWVSGPALSLTRLTPLAPAGSGLCHRVSLAVTVQGAGRSSQNALQETLRRALMGAGVRVFVFGVISRGRARVCGLRGGRPPEGQGRCSGICSLRAGLPTPGSRSPRPPDGVHTPLLLRTASPASCKADWELGRMLVTDVPWSRADLYPQQTHQEPLKMENSRGWARTDPGFIMPGVYTIWGPF